jgi:hypothetical protein
MAARPRKPFLMRASPGVMAAVEHLAAAELRSVNAQVEVLLREALARRGVSIAGPAAGPAVRNDPGPDDTA